MNSHPSIKEFVQDTLGCSCPDKVFEQIEDRQVSHPSSPHTRAITVGGRLLIYIWKADGQDEFQEKIPAMLEAGRKEREARGLNRFRAVLAVENPQTAGPAADLCFSHFKNRDDRMHIHVVHVDALQGFPAE